MVARATAPNKVGPESVFPDLGKWDFQDGLKGSPMASAPFWIAMICQIIIVIGYFWFYRKEQLGKHSCLFTILCVPGMLTIDLYSSPPMITTCKETSHSHCTRTFLITYLTRASHIRMDSGVR